MEHLDPSLLPPQIRSLLRILGTADTVSLLRLWGGQRRIIPFDPRTTTGALQGALSPDGLRALCRSEFGGLRIDLPKLDKVVRQAIHAAMREDRVEGVALNQIAARYGYTSRRVRQIAPLLPHISDDPQLTLPF